MAENARHTPRIFAEKTLHDGKYLSLRHAEWEGADGHRGHWEYATRRNASGAVAVFGLTARFETLLIRQFRIPVGRFTIELPAGLLDRPDEDPRLAVERELAEETGYTCRDIQPLFTTYSSPGMSNERLTVYSATLLERGAQRPDAAEDIHAYDPIPVDRLAAFLAEQEALGYAVDYKIMAAWGYMRATGKI